MLNVEHVAFSYNTTHPVLRDIDFTLESNQSLCILGPNGTGKTTLLRCMLGLLSPTSGRVSIDGKDVAHLGPRARAKLIAYVPQSSDMAFPYTVREVVMMGRTAHLGGARSFTDQDRSVAAECLERLQIGHLAKRRFNELSGGERQMALIARALAQQAQLLVMDEPTANLDYGNQIKVLRVVRSLVNDGYGILMTSHYPDHAFLICSHVLMMKGGRVVAQGSPDDVVTSETLSSLYDASVLIRDVDARGHGVKVCVPLLDEE